MTWRPLQALQPLLTLQPGQQRSRMQGWLGQPNQTDVYYIDTQPDKDNAIFGRVFAADVPRYRRDLNPVGAPPLAASARRTGGKNQPQAVALVGHHFPILASRGFRRRWPRFRPCPFLGS